MTILIETNRCRLRPFTEKDLTDFIDYRNNPEWMVYQGMTGRTLEEYRAILIGEADLTTGLQIAISQKSDNRVIGDIYLQQEEQTCWIGYTIAPKVARQGYAAEVLVAVIDYLKEQNFQLLKAGILPENLASVNLIKKLGFTFLEMEDDEAIFCLELH